MHWSYISFCINPLMFYTAKPIEWDTDSTLIKNGYGYTLDAL